MEYKKHNSRDSKQILLNKKDQQTCTNCELYTVGEVCYLWLSCFKLFHEHVLGNCRDDQPWCSSSNTFFLALSFHVWSVAWHRCNVVCHFNKSYSVLGWVTVFGQAYHLGVFQANKVNLALHHSWVAKLSTSFG